MSEVVLVAKGWLSFGTEGLGRGFGRFGPWRVAVAAGLILLAFYSDGALLVIRRSLADAYLQVSVFVAATLLLFYALEHWLRIDPVAALHRHKRWQVPLAAVLGSLPGCGGAIVVVTQYLNGGIRFGAFIAVLTSTMGDAAFLLLAKDPVAALWVFGISFVAGVCTGALVDVVHHENFMAPPRVQKSSLRTQHPQAPELFWVSIWFALLLPGVFFGALAAGQLEPARLTGWAWTNTSMTVWGAGGALLCLFMWALMPGTPSSMCDSTAPAKESPRAASAAPTREYSSSLGRVIADTNKESPRAASAAPTREYSSSLGRVIADTNFVTQWVVVAYLAYELTVYLTGWDLRAMAQIWSPFVPLAAILVGFIPGCGPQVVVTAMYIQGILPFSALIGNAISNDGDALLPSAAIAPKASLMATLYSAAPALLCAYTYYFFWE